MIIKKNRIGNVIINFYIFLILIKKLVKVEWQFVNLLKRNILFGDVELQYLVKYYHLLMYDHQKHYLNLKKVNLNIKLIKQGLYT